MAYNGGGVYSDGGVGKSEHFSYSLNFRLELVKI